MSNKGQHTTSYQQWLDTASQATLDGLCMGILGVLLLGVLTGLVCKVALLQAGDEIRRRLALGPDKSVSLQPSTPIVRTAGGVDSMMP